MRNPRYDLPRSGATSEGGADVNDESPDGSDDAQIREMENLLAEIGQDVSELKVSCWQFSRLDSELNLNFYLFYIETTLLQEKFREVRAPLSIL